MGRHDKAGPIGYRRLVVAQVRTVGGAHLHHVDAASGHYVRQAEGAADLDQLPARNHGLPAHGERVEHKQHGRSVVVDHGRRLCPRQVCQETLDQVIPGTPLPGVQIYLQVGVALRHRDQPVDRRPGQRRPSEVGVEHDAGGVHHRLQPWTQGLCHAPVHIADNAYQQLLPIGVLQLPRQHSLAHRAQ